MGLNSGDHRKLWFAIYLFVHIFIMYNVNKYFVGCIKRFIYLFVNIIIMYNVNKYFVGGIKRFIYFFVHIIIMYK